MQVHIKKIYSANLLAAFENDSWLKKNVWDVSSVNKKLLDSITLTLNVLIDASKTSENIRSLRNFDF